MDFQAFSYQKWQAVWSSKWPTITRTITRWLFFIKITNNYPNNYPNNHRASPKRLPGEFMFQIENQSERRSVFVGPESLCVFCFRCVQMQRQEIWFCGVLASRVQSEVVDLPTCPPIYMPASISALSFSNSVRETAPASSKPFNSLSSFIHSAAVLCRFAGGRVSETIDPERTAGAASQSATLFPVHVRGNPPRP